MWNFPRMLAHRGGGTLAPENTLAALRCGHAHGFRAVEFDVMGLSDGSLVLMHDEELGRTVAGQGSVADCTLAQLSASDAGSWFSAEFAGGLAASCPFTGTVTCSFLCLFFCDRSNVQAGDS